MWLAERPRKRLDAARAAYLDHFVRRLAAPRAFVTEAIRAHDAHL